MELGRDRDRETFSLRGLSVQSFWREEIAPLMAGKEKLSSDAARHFAEDLLARLNDIQSVHRTHPELPMSGRLAEEYRRLHESYRLDDATRQAEPSTIGVSALCASCTGGVYAATRNRRVVALKRTPAGFSKEGEFALRTDPVAMRVMPSRSVAVACHDAVMLFHPIGESYHQERLPNSRGTQHLDVLSESRLLGAGSGRVCAWRPGPAGEWAYRELFQRAYARRVQAVDGLGLIVLSDGIELWQQSPGGKWSFERACPDASVRGFTVLKDGGIVAIGGRGLSLCQRNSAGVWEQEPIGAVESDFGFSVLRVQEFGLGELLVTTTRDLRVLTRGASRSQWSSRTIVESGTKEQFHCTLPFNDGEILVAGAEVEEVRTDLFSVDVGFGWVRAYGAAPGRGPLPTA